MTLKEALQGKDIPEEIYAQLALVEVPYLSFEGVLEAGQLVVHKDLSEEVEEIFTLLLAHNFPIEKIVPVNVYGWEDEASMLANNTSCFNYRTIAGTKRLSNHATGKAIDINPKLNPYTHDDIVSPKGALYDPSIPGTLVENSHAVALFLQRGWEWGGHWDDRKDYQHFQKPE